MRNYDSYFLMSAADAADYVLRSLSFFRPSDELEASEIETGNLNYIFRVRDRRSDRSLVIKQAGGTTIEEVLALFVEKWNALLRECATEPVARYEGFGQWHLQQMLADAAGVAGLELCRRIVGIAQVRDITGIQDPRARTRAERACLRAAKRFIIDRDHVRSGGDFLTIMRDAAREQALA